MIPLHFFYQIYLSFFSKIITLHQYVANCQNTLTVLTLRWRVFLQDVTMSQIHDLITATPHHHPLTPPQTPLWHLLTLMDPDNVLIFGKGNPLHGDGGFPLVIQVVSVMADV